MLYWTAQRSNKRKNSNGRKDIFKGIAAERISKDGWERKRRKGMEAREERGRERESLPLRTQGIHSYLQRDRGNCTSTPLKDWRARSLTDFRFILKRLVTHKFICLVYSRAKLFARLDTISTIWMMKPDKITSVTRKHQYRFTRNRSSRVEKRRNHPRFITSTFIIRSMASFLHCISLEIWRERITKKRQCDMTTDCVRENGYYEGNIYRLIALKNSM